MNGLNVLATFLKAMGRRHPDACLITSQTSVNAGFHLVIIHRSFSRLFVFKERSATTSVPVRIFLDAGSRLAHLTGARGRGLDPDARNQLALSEINWSQDYPLGNLRRDIRYNYLECQSLGCRLYQIEDGYQSSLPMCPQYYLIDLVVVCLVCLAVLMTA